MLKYHKIVQLGGIPVCFQAVVPIWFKMKCFYSVIWSRVGSVTNKNTQGTIKDLTKDTQRPASFLTYGPLQNYWCCKASAFIFAVHWTHLDLTSKDKYETRDQYVGFHFKVLTSRTVKKNNKKNLEDSTLCLNPHIFQVSNIFGTDRVFFWLPRCWLLKQWIAQNVYSQF